MITSGPQYWISTVNVALASSPPRATNLSHSEHPEAKLFLLAVVQTMLAAQQNHAARTDGGKLGEQRK